MTHYHGTTECNCQTWRRAELIGIVLAAVAAYVVLPHWMLVLAAAAYWIHLLRSRRADGPSPGDTLAALAPTERKASTTSPVSPTSPTSPVELPPAITPVTEAVGEDEYRITPFVFTAEPEQHDQGEQAQAAPPPTTRRDTPRDIKAALLAPAITVTSEDDASARLATTMSAAALSDAKAVDAKIDKILGGERGPNISHGRRRKVKAPPAYSATANTLETVLEVDHDADHDDDCVSDTELDYAQPPPYAPSPMLGPSLAPPVPNLHHRSHSAGEADFDAAAKAALRRDVEREIDRQRQLERERAREIEREQRNIDPLVAAELLAEIQRAREMHAASSSASTSSPKLRPRSDSSSSTATRRLPRTPLSRLSLPLDDSDGSSVFSLDLDAPYDGQVDADIDELLLSPASMASSFDGESSSAAARAILRAKSARSRLASIRRKRTDSGETADSETSSPATPQDRKGKGRAIPSLPPMSYAFGSPVVLPATPRWREGRSE